VFLFRIAPLYERGKLLCVLLLLLFRQRVLHVKHPIELAEHKAEHACWDAQRGTEHDAHVPHVHLVHARVLHDQDEVHG
jgi:hypothetical protein